MIAIFKREIKNYLKRPLFWVGVLLVIYGVFNATSPYLTTHYLTTGEEIINDQSNTSVEGEVYEGYIPATPEKHREVWHEKVKIIYLPKTESYHPTALSGIPHRSHRHTPDTYRK